MVAVSRVELQLETGNAEQKLSRVQKLAQATQGAFGRLAAAGNSLQGALVGIGAGSLVKGFVSAGIEASRTEKRLKLLAGQYGESARLANFAQVAADKFAIGNTAAASAVTDLYGRLRPMGISLEDIQTTFLGVNNAAAKMNLSAADTEGVMLQLSQALGSGKLQGDEFRSIMERLPAIGQAVAKSMGVEVAQLKELSSQGKLTTEEIIKALGDLSKQQPPPPDAFKEFQKSISDLGTVIGTQILPALTPLVKALGGLASFIGNLPGPLKPLVAGAVALGGALAIIAPLLAPIVSLFGAIIPAITAIGSALAAVAPVLIGLFTGPVGWVALLVAAGAAIFAFRDQIGQAFQAIGNFFKAAFTAYKNTFIDPVIEIGGKLLQALTSVFSRIGEAIKAPFQAAMAFVKGIINGMLRGIASAINGVVGAINRIISAANVALGKLNLPQIPTLPNVSVPQFADGGMVTKPTLAMVGEGGENEYIIPQSKAADFATNYLGGKRGLDAVPGFANGGFVRGSTQMDEAMSRYAGGQRGSSVIPSSINPQVNVTTGPVMNMSGSNYVSQNDFMAGMQTASRRGAEMALQMLTSSPQARRMAGIG